MRRWRDFLAGFLAAALMMSMGMPSMAATARQLNASYNNIKITLDGKTLTPKDANGATVEPFIVDGTTYLPVRAVADSLGLGVEWDAKTQTVKLTTGGTNSSASADALSEQAYKAKILEIGSKVSELTPSVSAAQQKASSDPEGALKDLIAIVAKMKPLYQELADLKAPSKYAAAQAKIKEGSQASVDMLDLTVEMMELALDPNRRAEAQQKMNELNDKLVQYQSDAQKLSEGLTEVMGL